MCSLNDNLQNKPNFNFFFKKTLWDFSPTILNARKNPGGGDPAGGGGGGGGGLL